MPKKIAMPQASIVNVDHCASLIEALPGCYESESYTDVILHCKGGRSVKAHRLLLGSVSPLLRGLFEEQRCRDTTEIIIPDVECENLENLIRYLYEGFIRLDEREANELKSLRKLLAVQVPMTIARVPLTEDQETDEEIILDSDEIVSTSAEISCHTLNNNQQKQVNQKRKLTPINSSNAKKSKTNGSCGGQIVQNLNDILQNFVPTASELPVCSAEKREKERPLIVPIEHFKTFVQRVEEKKALKKIETIVEESVCRYLLKQPTKVLETSQSSAENKSAVDKSLQTEPETFHNDSNSVSNNCSGIFSETTEEEEKSLKKNETDIDQSFLSHLELSYKDLPSFKKKSPKTYGKTSKGDQQSSSEGASLIKANQKKVQDVKSNPDHDYGSPSPGVVPSAVTPQANKNLHVSLERSASSVSLSHHVVSLGGSPMKILTSARSSVAHNKLRSVNVENHSTQSFTSGALPAIQRHPKVGPNQYDNQDVNKAAQEKPIGS